MDGGHVQGGVEVPFRSGAFAKVGDGAVAFARQLLTVGVARGLGDLRGQWRGNGHVVQLAGTVMNWHLATFAIVQFVAEQLVHELINRKTAIGQRALFTVLSHDHVGVIQCGGTANNRGFLAGALHVKAQAPLPLGREHAFVENPGGDHRPVDAQGFVFVELRSLGAFVERAVLLE